MVLVLKRISWMRGELKRRGQKCFLSFTFGELNGNRVRKRHCDDLDKTTTAWDSSGFHSNHLNIEKRHPRGERRRKRSGERIKTKHWRTIGWLKENGFDFLFGNCQNQSRFVRINAIFVPFVVIDSNSRPNASDHLYAALAASCVATILTFHRSNVADVIWADRKFWKRIKILQ